MKRLLLFIPLFLLSVYALAQIDKVIPKRPNPPTLVNDFTNTLTHEQIAALESKLVTYDDSTSNQIAIVIIPTTGNYSVEEVALEILRPTGWGVGNKNTNNGIVLLVAKDDHK
ncbi:MAG TPA: TPM domain-containing protein, partial [Chitinophagaceae bacterium]|nr:TPM domain-containing protein [Chitinophagaceae bacterium]